MISIHHESNFDSYPDGFKDLLNTLSLDEVGDYIKTDEIILMFGLRSFCALNRKKDKVTEARKSVRA